MFIDTDGVKGLAAKWAAASEGLGRAGERMRAAQLDIDNHHDQQDDLMAGISEVVKRHADGMDTWAAYHRDFGDKLLATIDAFVKMDHQNTKNVGGDAD